MGRATVLLIMTCGLLAGCGPDEPVDPEEAVCIDLPAPETSPVLIVGAVEAGEFLVVDDGSTLVLQHGIQGGTHLDLAARVFSLASSRLVLELTIEGSSRESTTVAADPCSGWIEIVGRVFDPSEGDARLRVRLLDDGGAELATEELDVYVL